ncbi:MAG: hypothetical protein ABFD64_02920 [Armatimonadota bacterium]
MSIDIEEYKPVTGRHVKEDGTVVNIADLLDLPTSSTYFSGDTGATPNTAVEKALGGTSRAIYLKNTHSTATLLISLDDGTTYGELLPGEAFVDEALALDSILVKSATASCTYKGWWK